MRRAAAYVLILAFSSVPLGGIALTPTIPTDAKPFRSAFEGFVFVGSVPIASKESRGPRIVSHGTTRQTFPSHFQGSRLYVFHHRRPVDNVRLAIDVLPSRLKRSGVSITSSPMSPLDLIYVYVGGPLFRIECEMNKRRMVIYNRVDAALVKTMGRHKWAPDDYIVAIDEPQTP
jgi:hypothetical protein